MSLWGLPPSRSQRCAQFVGRWNDGLKGLWSCPLRGSYEAGIPRVHAREVQARSCRSFGRAITLDVLIGEADYLGRGFGSKMIEDFINIHFLDVVDILIDPEERNARAIKDYSKAGFVPILDFLPDYNPVPHRMMRLARLLGG